MSKLRILTCAAALLIWAASAGWAGGGDTFLEGTASGGGHYYDSQDEIGRVGEYVSQEDVHHLLPDISARLNGGTSSTLFDILLLYRDSNTQGMGFDLQAGDHLSVDLDYRSFSHNLDHDLLQNMGARERVYDPNLNGGAGGFKPGGKQIYHTDNDPLGRYSLHYERMQSGLAIALPFIDNGQVYANYDDQRKSGWKQSTTIDHCAFCHVESHAQRIDDQTKIWRAGAGGTSGKVSFNYEFNRAEYYDFSGIPQREWSNAQHPVFGNFSADGATNYGAEFGSRLVYDDVTLPYNQGTEGDKTSHEASVKLDLDQNKSLRGSYTRTDRTNWFTNVESQFDAYAASFTARPSKKMRLTARFLAYETKVDDTFVDLPPWRDGRGGGGQDFDWTRISAANRSVVQTDLNLGYRLAGAGYLQASWRHQEIDRDAMAQSQTNYLNEGGVALEVPAAPYANQTSLDRVKLSLSQRFGLKGNGRVSYTFTNVSDAYMNPTAMCEEGLNGQDYTLPGNGLVYYFQRLRQGNGTNQPSQSHKIAARGSYQLSARASLSGYVNYATEKNDDLNIYEYERTLLSPGVNFWTAPSDRLMLTLGYAFNSIESNANLCPPFFDG